MRIMKHHLLFLWFLCALTVQHLHAQPGSLKFDTRIKDLGRLPGKGKCVFSHKFKFYNSGDNAFTVDRVEPTCGCTVADYTKDKVAPGDSGYIMATFDPHGQSGPFNKSISVSSVGIDLGVEILFLKGYVVSDSVCKSNTKPKENEQVVRRDKPKPKPKKNKEEQVQVTIPQPFKHTFGYGHSKIDPNNPRLVNWLKQVVRLAEVNDEVQIRIESSASKVPTGPNTNNMELAADRAQNTRELVRTWLMQRGLKSSQINFVEDEVSVQGPEYAGDAQSNPAKYEQYQYVKIKVN